jgi:hypothetical protein
LLGTSWKRVSFTNCTSNHRMHPFRYALSGLCSEFDSSFAKMPKTKFTTVHESS